MSRVVAQQSVDCDTTEAASDEVFCGGMYAGTVCVPGDSSITKLTFHVSHNSVKYYPLYAAATAVELTVVAGRAYQLPDTLRGAHSFKMVSDAAGRVYVSLQE